MSENKWVVCKFGGTSVSSAKTWDVIVNHARKLSDEGYKVCIVVSAVSQVTNTLEKVINGLAKEVQSLRKGRAPDAQPLTDEASEAMQWILERHEKHCQDLNVDMEVIKPFLQELKRLVEGIRLTGDAASSRLRARVLGFGELMSSYIGEQVLKRELRGLNVGLIDARQVLVSGGSADVDSIGQKNAADRFLNAEVTPFALDFDIPASFEEATGSFDASSIASTTGYDPRTAFFVNKDVVITQGFIASTREGQPCVLGRGGSDTSGALFGALLSAERVEIWTDVDGMFSSDPRRVPKAHLIEELSYREAQELAAMGAKVLHPRCLGPASWANIPVEIHNTMAQSEKLTRIMPPECLQHGGESTVMAIARRTGQVLLTISTVDMWGASGFLSRVFAPFERLDISVDLLATSQYAVSMTLDYIPGGISGEPFKALLRALKKQGSVHVETACTVVSIVGRKLRSVLHGMADAFKELERFNILLLSESTEDLNMSFVLKENEQAVDELVLKLHRVLLEQDISRSSELPTAVSSTPTGVRPSLVSAASSPVPRKLRSPSFSSGGLSIPAPAVTSSRLSNAGLLHPEDWLENELAKYASVQTPFGIIDLETLKQNAAGVTVFPMSWSSQPAVLRAVFEANQGVVFLCRSAAQVLELCSVVGPSPSVFMSPVGASSSGFNAAIPPSVRLQSAAPSEESLVSSLQTLGQARLVVASVVDEMDGDTYVVDAWFQGKPYQRLSLFSKIPDNVTKVKAMSAHEDSLDTLFVLEPREGSGDQGLPLQRLVMVGVASTAFNTCTQSPIQEFIRF